MWRLFAVVQMERLCAEVEGPKREYATIKEEGSVGYMKKYEQIKTPSVWPSSGKAWDLRYTKT